MAHQIRDLVSLLEEMENGFLPKFLFFWGHTQRDPSIIDKSCLSQWFPAPFTVDDQSYPTAEHYMMAEKARMFGDDESLKNILTAQHPKQAKDHGRSIINFVEEVWEQERFEIVVRGNLAKFTQDDDLKVFLLSTKERILVEASPTDQIWGIGYKADELEAQKPYKWRGLNLLGFSLMEVRSRILEAEKVEDEL